MRLLLALLLLAPALPAQDDLQADVAAIHPEGKWKIRKAEFYRYLVDYYGEQPVARMGLPDYLKQRLILAEARRLKLTVTDADMKRWIGKLDRQVRQAGGGAQSLKALAAQFGMSEAALERRAKVAILRERVARTIMLMRDKTRDPEQELQEGTVTLVVDELYKVAPKQLDRSKLPKNVVARIGSVEVTSYEYGRELTFTLPATEVARALNALILVKEVNLLVGNEDPPTPEELEGQKTWFLTFEKNRLARLSGGRQQITDDMVKQVLARRGLTLEKAFANPAFLAEARARGYFLSKMGDSELRAYYTSNKPRYSDELKVARIFVVARAQRVKLAGKKVRSLEQGKALADALWVRATQGEDFTILARKNSEDADVIRRNGGLLPFLVTAQTPGYEDTWAQANILEVNGISRPFFSQGRGYVIVKLIERSKALGFEARREEIRGHAAIESYRAWRFKALQSARKSASLREQGGTSAGRSG
ncbi:MAG: peptidylprolyl isomerase [Planctomycetota bacterium]|jgi:biotin operon repressor